jgi:uncharacterized protein YndB with AHSA1/START domain
MAPLVKRINIKISHEQAFKKFVIELLNWWPREYTWSQNKLVEIKIDPRKDGLCTEIGPYDFRCDWGRVTKIEENKKLEFKWQIGPKREPVPDPEHASDIKIQFEKDTDLYTALIFEHANFQNHGEGADEYQKAMASKQGWEYILNKFKTYCEEE